MAARDRDRTPAALAPHLKLPTQSSLLLFTGTSSCTANWLLAHLISSVLRPSKDEIETEKTENAAIIFVSWMRDLPFWISETRRLTGLDLTRPPYTTSFAFLDCITPAPLSTLESRITALITKLATPARPVLLILDYPTLALLDIPTPSTPNTPLNPHSPTSNLQILTSLLLTLRTKVHSIALHLPSDAAFLHASTPTNSNATAQRTTPLDHATAAFTATVAHAARWVMGTRELETGAAKDVSGVIRVGRGGGWYEDEEAVESDEGSAGEWLYFVGRDGVVKVFKRGNEIG